MTSVSFRNLRWALAVPLLAVVAWLVLPFLLPSRGLDRAWSRLIDAVEDRDAAALNVLLADDYHDGFGFDREQAVTTLTSVFGQFVTLDIRRERPAVHIVSAQRGATEALIRVSGHGTPIAQMIAQGSAGLATPTTFHWRRNSWRAWDWQLTSIENAAVRADVARLRRELKRHDSQTGGLVR